MRDSYVVVCQIRLAFLRVTMMNWAIPLRILQRAAIFSKLNGSILIYLVEIVEWTWLVSCIAKISARAAIDFSPPDNAVLLVF